jgi:hypothetical protein
VDISITYDSVILFSILLGYHRHVGGEISSTNIDMYYLMHSSFCLFCISIEPFFVDNKFISFENLLCL